LTNGKRYVCVSIEFICWSCNTNSQTTGLQRLTNISPASDKYIETTKQHCGPTNITDTHVCTHKLHQHHYTDIYRVGRTHPSMKSCCEYLTSRISNNCQTSCCRIMHHCRNFSQDWLFWDSENRSLYVDLWCDFTESISWGKISWLDQNRHSASSPWQIPHQPNIATT